jgi:alanine racemase
MSIKDLLGRKYYPLNKITISKKQLFVNYHCLNALHKNVPIAPVLKSNAYGHGLNLIAPLLDKLKPPFFCVDSLYEAYELKKLRVKTPILIMGYVAPENLKVKKLNFCYTIYDYHQAEALNKFQKGAKIHIKVDTGMHRLGIPIHDLDTFIKKIKNLKHIQIEGLMSHLSSPKTFPDYTKIQIKNYKIALKILQKNNINPKWKHLAASGGLLNYGRELEKITNLSRVGIALFGLYRTNKVSKLMPVLKLTTQIVQIKKIALGQYVGYDKAFRAKNDMEIAILPIGYNDGLDRRLTNIGVVKIRKTYCPIIGKVSMNITVVDVTGVGAKTGNTVTVFSDKVNDKNSLENAANSSGTIPHDLLVHLHTTAVKRVII